MSLIQSLSGFTHEASDQSGGCGNAYPAILTARLQLFSMTETQDRVKRSAKLATVPSILLNAANSIR